MAWILSSMICESPSSVNLSLMHVYWSPGDKTRDFILELAQMRPVNQANDFDVCLYGEPGRQCFQDHGGKDLKRSDCNGKLLCP